MRTLGLLIVVGVLSFAFLSNSETTPSINLGSSIDMETNDVSPYIPPETMDDADRLEGPLQDLVEVVRVAKSEIKFWAEARKVMQSWFKAMASINVDSANNFEEKKIDVEEGDVTVEVSQWTPPHPQVILFFYSEDAKDYMVKQANKLIDEGHKVYRAAPDRADLFSQYEVTETPMWLVIRGKEVIYRHNEPPVFPSMRAIPPAQSLDDKYEEMSRALQRRDDYGIQHITPGTSRYRTPSCSNGTCGW